MTRLIRPMFLAAAALLSAGGATLPVTAFAQSDATALARTSIPDTTPEQRYQTAIREAGGGLKLNLQACREGPASERQECEKVARSRYQADMAYARRLRVDPKATPRPSPSTPIIVKEVTTIVRP